MDLGLAEGREADREGVLDETEDVAGNRTLHVRVVLVVVEVLAEEVARHGGWPRAARPVRNGPVPGRNREREEPGEGERKDRVRASNPAQTSHLRESKGRLA